MGDLVLSGATSGSITVTPTAVAGSNTITLPAGTGNAVVNNVNSAIVRGTSVNASSTSVDFTSIPSWVRRITVIFNGVSLNGTANFLFQIGDSGGIETTGYNSSTIYAGSATGNGFSTAGYLSIDGASSNVMSGSFVFVNISGNIWIMTGTSANDGGTVIVFVAGTKTLSDTLDRVRITTSNGTDTFDAGSINILYE